MKTVCRLLALTAVAMSATILPVVAAPAKVAPKAKSAAEKMPAKAVCPVCAVKTGKKVMEPVKASLKYKGKMYYFCDLNEKAEFISNPAKYAAAVK
jgi:YHS domain-containing protein